MNVSVAMLTVLKVTGCQMTVSGSSPCRQASVDELKASYRRLCMLYHPDKHRDPELKRQAELLFNQVHQAYEGKTPRERKTQRKV